MEIILNGAVYSIRGSLTDGTVSGMIDYVHLACDAHIRWNELHPMKWYRDDMPDGEITHVHTHRGVRIKYYPARERITIKGKILMLLHDTQVRNVDDVCCTHIHSVRNTKLAACLNDVNGSAGSPVPESQNKISRLNDLKISFERRSTPIPVIFRQEFPQGNLMRYGIETSRRICASCPS